MTAMTDTTRTERGISLQVLFAAIGMTAVLTGTVAWLLLTPPTEPAATGAEHENAPPAGVVELTPEAQRNATLGLIKAEERRTQTHIGKKVAGNRASSPERRGRIHRDCSHLGRQAGIRRSRPCGRHR